MTPLLIYYSILFLIFLIFLFFKPILLTKKFDSFSKIILILFFFLNSSIYKEIIFIKTNLLIGLSLSTSLIITLIIKPYSRNLANTNENIYYFLNNFSLLNSSNTLDLIYIILIKILLV